MCIASNFGIGESLGHITLCDMSKLERVLIEIFKNYVSKYSDMIFRMYDNNFVIYLNHCFILTVINDACRFLLLFENEKTCK